MTSSQTLNQLAHSLLEFIPNLNISDVVVPQLNKFKSAKDRETTQYVPLIFFASKEALAQGLTDQVDSKANIPFQTIDLQSLNNLLNQKQTTIEEPKSIDDFPLDQTSQTPYKKAFLQKILTKIEENLEDEFFRVEHLAESVSMSVNSLNRKLNRLKGQTAGKLIRSIRLQRAADLLRQTPESISQIAYATGFSSHASFNRSFKQCFGVSPTAYIKELSE